MQKDTLLKAIEQRRRRPPLRILMEDPLGTISQKTYLLYLISFFLGSVSVSVALSLGIGIVDAIVPAFVLAIIPPGFYDFYKRRRISRLEKEFPAFIRGLTLSLKAGMPLQGAMEIAAKGDYGALSGPIRHLHNMISWGIPFDETLLYFARKYPTPLIKRTISTIIEASRAGGEIGVIMESVAADVEETKFLETRRDAETKPYLVVCYVSFFVFLFVILVLCYMFLPMMEKAAGVSPEGGLPGGWGFAVSKEDLELYNRLFFHTLLLQGFFAGLVTGKIGEGAMYAGLKHSVIFIIISAIAYTVLL